MLGTWYLTHNDIAMQEKLVFSAFFLGAIICLGFSFAFHTLACHSVGVVRIFSKLVGDHLIFLLLKTATFFRLDYAGISLLIIGSFVPYIYYAFFCRKVAKIIYISMIIVLGTVISFLHQILIRLRTRFRVQSSSRWQIDFPSLAIDQFERLFSLQWVSAVS